VTVAVPDYEHIDILRVGYFIILSIEKIGLKWLGYVMAGFSGDVKS
jgi:hypothetical protein